MALAAFPAACVAFVAASCPCAASSPAVATPANVAASPALCVLVPNSAPVKAENICPSIMSPAMIRLIPMRMGFNRLIKPWPKLALKLSHCSFRMRVWFAQEVEVRAKSPCASPDTESR